MVNNEKYPIKEEWDKYYKTLEGIRRSGVVNMWGAHPYLRECYREELSNSEAQEILCNWIHNYDTLNKKYNWQN